MSNRKQLKILVSTVATFFIISGLYIRTSNLGVWVMALFGAFTLGSVCHRFVWKKEKVSSEVSSASHKE